MPTRVFAASGNNGRVYVVGRVGLDNVGDDVGGPYEGILRTERISPAGEGGLVLFRRVVVRFWHTGSFSGELRAFVDGVQTRVYAGGTFVDQVVSFTVAPPNPGPDGGGETLVEFAVSGRGTWVEVELRISSDDVAGVVLPETLWVGHRKIRVGRQQSVVTS